MENQVASPPIEKRHSLTRFYFLFVLILAVPAVILCYCLFVWVPGYREVFMNFHETLPPMTQTLLKISDSTVTVISFLLLGIVLLPWPLARFVNSFETSIQRASTTLIIVMAVALFGMASVLLIWDALLQPLAKLVHDVSGSGMG